MKREKRRPVDTGESLPYIEAADAAGALSKRTALRETIKRVTSDYGTQLRMNRSIQAEGSFANIKEDMEFRRYLYRGKANVTAQSILLAIGYNINKLHHKIQAGRTGRHLFPLKQTA